LSLVQLPAKKSNCSISSFFMGNRKSKNLHIHQPHISQLLIIHSITKQENKKISETYKNKREKGLFYLLSKNLFLNWLIRCYTVVFCSCLAPRATIFTEYLEFKVLNRLKKAITGTCAFAYKTVVLTEYWSFSGLSLIIPSVCLDLSAAFTDKDKLDRLL
jgi:hypothetical protein